MTKKSVSKILTERLREMVKADKMMEGELGQDADHIYLTGLYSILWKSCFISFAFMHSLFIQGVPI